MSTVFNRVGPYEILREVGRGGMAVVFLALDTRTSSQVALKLVPQGSDREAREILEAEEWGAELQKQFCQVSPHVPTVFEHGLEPPYFYVAMEYVDGENLSDVISRGPVPVADAVSTAVELCRFLEDAHRFEVTIRDRQLRLLLHGDLKPRNVRITSAGQVKVLDFGIAKALSLSRKVTRNDFGSVAYLSPERLETGEVDSYADFWAVGVLLHEMLSGTPPFRAADTRQLEKQILSRRPAPVLNGNCPHHLQAVVAKLLAPDPTARYDTAQGIREDLERAASGEETTAETEGWPARAQDEAPTRRTRAPVEREKESEATRRTSQPGAGAPAVVVPPPIPPVAAALAPKKRRRWLRRLAPVALLGLLIMVASSIGNEREVARAADRLAASIPALDMDALPEAWKQHDLLKERGSARVSELRRSLTAHTETLVNGVIDNYREPRPSVREAQWRAARAALARAVAAAPDDKRLKAALRYCEGHLHRINGEAKKVRKQVAAEQELTEAVKAFREAAELRPGWPDPFLGLARTFLYGLEDVDRGADALTQAESNGHTLADREIVQLADGYRLRGETLSRSARHVAGLPQERDYLRRAAEAYRQAVAQYDRADDYPNVARNLGLTQRRLEQVRQRLAEIEEPEASVERRPEIR